jgi:hypothetical protein
MRRAVALFSLLMLSFALPCFAAEAPTVEAADAPLTAGAEKASGGKTPAAENAAAPAKARTRIYNFQDLLTQSERIVVADVGATRDGLTRLTVRETLKAPRTDRTLFSSERRQRAADLLVNPDAKLAEEAPLKVSPGPSAVYVRAQNLTLPREGAQVLFFLWEKSEAPAADSVAYSVSHPQNIYDLDVVPEVRTAVQRPRAVGDGRYLRPWDREMAARLRQRESDEALIGQKGGETVGGFALKGLRPLLSLRNDNSFAVTAQIQNTLAREQGVYDGPAGGYGVVLTPEKGDGDALILRLSQRQLVVDSAVLAIADITDFASISAGQTLSRELFFDVKDFPVLGRIEGAYKVKVFYSTQQDGRGLDLDMPVWTGTLLSETIDLSFLRKKQ